MSAADENRRLWKAVAAALAVAAVVLVTVVLPAEYGVDPTSVGRLIGLDRLYAPAPAARAAPDDGAAAVPDELAAIMEGNTVPAEPGSHRTHAAAFRQDETLIRLDAFEEVELKARMSAGDTLLYSWASPAPVYVDTHGEPFDYPASPAVRYTEKDGAAADHGRITASFAGLHGWYWLNTNETPVTVTLKTGGFYESLEEVYRNTP